MHYHVLGSCRAKFDEDSFRGIACEGHTHTHGSSTLKVANVAYDFANKKQDYMRNPVHVFDNDNIEFELDKVKNRPLSV